MVSTMRIWNWGAWQIRVWLRERERDRERERERKRERDHSITKIVF